MPKFFFTKKSAIYLALGILLIGAQIYFQTIIQNIYAPFETISLVQYLSVGACFLVALVCFSKSLAWLFTTIALALTLCADAFLVLPPTPNQLPGMAFFVGAQVFYCCRILLKQTKKQRLTHLIIRLSLSLLGALATLLVMKDQATLVMVISIIYYANLLLNIIYAFIIREFTFAVGLVLFAFCDLFIGLTTMANFFGIVPGTPLYPIVFPSFNIAWAFYTPSQTLIALSVLKNHVFVR